MLLLYLSSKKRNFITIAWLICEPSCYLFLEQFLYWQEIQHCSKYSDITARKSSQTTHLMLNEVSLMMNIVRTLRRLKMHYIVVFSYPYYSYTYVWEETLFHLLYQHLPLKGNLLIWFSIEYWRWWSTWYFVDNWRTMFSLIRLLLSRRALNYNLDTTPYPLVYSVPYISCRRCALVQRRVLRLLYPRHVEI